MFARGWVKVTAVLTGASLLLGVLTLTFDLGSRVAGWFGASDDPSSAVGPMRSGTDNGDPTTCPDGTVNLRPVPIPEDVAGLEDHFVKLRVSPRDQCDVVWALTSQPAASRCSSSLRNCVEVWVVRKSDDKRSLPRSQASGTRSVHSLHLENDGGEFMACVASLADPERTFCTGWQRTRP